MYSYEYEYEYEYTYNNKYKYERVLSSLGLIWTIWQSIYARADCPLHRALVPSWRSFIPSTGIGPDAGTASSGAGWGLAGASGAVAVAAAKATTGSNSWTSASSSIAPGSQQQQQQSGCPLSSYEYFAGGATRDAGAGLSGASLANLAPLNAAVYPVSAAPFQAYYQSPAVDSSFLNPHGVTGTAIPPTALQPASNQQLFNIEQQSIKQIEQGLRMLINAE